MDMHPGTNGSEPPTTERERPALTGVPSPRGDWTFERGGQVFGPVTGLSLGTMVEEGRIDATTRVRREGEPWRELGSVPELIPMLREARTRARQAADARRTAQRARWNASARWTAWTLLIGAAVVVVAAGAAYLSVKRPWQARSALLADFGDIRIGSPHVVAATVRDGTPEVAVPDLRLTAERRGAATPPPSAAAGTRPAAPSREREARTDAEPAGIVAAQFNPGRIEQVLTRHRDRLAECVRGEARRSPEFQGAIPIEFAIGNDGRVTELWVDEPRFKTGPLRDCFLDVLRLAEFQPFAGQRPVVSLAFHIGGR